MRETRDPEDDSFDVRRFVDAQATTYALALAEIRRGHKRNHWMWFIFPQVAGLGSRPTAKRFAIKSIDEARQYRQHPMLGPRLLECAEAVLAIEGRAIAHVFGYPDTLKLKSSMTLFAQVAAPDSVFARVREKYFNGQMDGATLHIVGNVPGETRKEQA